MEKYYTRLDEDVLEIRLYSLDEYEMDGGTYNGEEVSKDDFLAAMTVWRWDDGLAVPADDILPSQLGADAWLDSITGYYLLRTWPVSAPLSVRF